jgi:hypothetical protein
MEGNVDFMECGSTKQHILLLLQERAIGGKDHTEAKGLRNAQIFLQVWVAQWLAHQVEVEKIRVRLQLWHQPAEFLRLHRTGRSFGSRAEAASQIADIGYFQVHFSKSFHFPSPFELLGIL